MLGDAVRGRALARQEIAAGRLPGVELDKMLDRLDVIAYLHEQRARVQAVGECSGGCGQTEEVPHSVQPVRVCPHTLQPCLARQVQPIVNLFQECGL